MAGRFNRIGRGISALWRKVTGRAQPPPPPQPEPPPPAPSRPSPVRRSGPDAERVRGIMRTVAALHATGVTDQDEDSHSPARIADLETEVGRANASELLKEQLESTRAYLALARQLGRWPRVGESQPGNERWHGRDSKYASLRAAPGTAKTMNLPNWYDKFFWYHGTKM